MSDFESKMKKQKADKKRELQLVQKEMKALKEKMNEAEGKECRVLKKQRELLKESLQQAQDELGKVKLRAKGSRATQQTNMGSREYKKISGQSTAGEVGFGSPCYRAF